MTTTPISALPHPQLTDTADVPRDIGALADKIDPGIVPVGALMMWLGSAVPNVAWLFCQGQVNISAATYPALAAVLGTIAPANIYVKMPDMIGRILVGVGAVPGSNPAVSNVLNSKSGQGSVMLSASQSGIPAHDHGATGLATGAGGSHNHGGGTGGMNRSNPHSHYAHNPPINPGDAGWSTTLETGGGSRHVPFNNNYSGGALGFVDNTDVNHEHAIGAQAAHTHTVTGTTADNVAAQAAAYHDNMPPYYTVNYIIRAL